MKKLIILSMSFVSIGSSLAMHDRPVRAVSPREHLPTVLTVGQSRTITVSRTPLQEGEMWRVRGCDSSIIKVDKRSHNKFKITGLRPGETLLKFSLINVERQSRWFRGREAQLVAAEYYPIVVVPRRAPWEEPER